MNTCGLGYTWQEQYTHGDAWLKEVLKQNIADQFAQTWSTDVNNSSKCSTYKMYKTDLEFENYFYILPYPKYISFCKFRTCNHKLPVEIGRHRGLPRHERLCTLCNERKLGDEFHFALECSALKNIRSRYIDIAYTNRPNALKFGQLFSSNDRSVLLKLVKFIQVAS